MRFVEDHGINSRQHAVVLTALELHGRRRKKEMMIDNDDICLLRSQARTRHKALARVLTVFSEAIACGACHGRPHSAVFGHTADVIDVTRFGAVQKNADPSKILHRFTRSKRDFASFAHIDAMSTQVVGAALEQRYIGWQSTGSHQCRNILAAQLFLKRLAGRTDDDSAASNQSGRKVCKGLAGSGSGFSQKLAFALQRSCHSQSKLDLRRTRYKTRRCLRKRTVGSKSPADSLFIVSRENGAQSDGGLVSERLFRRVAVLFKLSKRNHRRLDGRRNVRHLLEIVG